MRRELVALTVVLMLVGITMAAQGGPDSAASSGWGVTTNHHGEDVLIGDLISGATDLRVKLLVADDPAHFGVFYRVTIHLRDENEEVVAEMSYDKDDLSPWEDWTAPNGRAIKYAWTDPVDEWDNPMEPDEWTLGHYSVKAFYYAIDGQSLGNDEDLEAMRATTQMVVPEAPTGTLAVLLAMFAGLALFAKKRS